MERSMSIIFVFFLLGIVRSCKVIMITWSVNSDADDDKYAKMKGFVFTFDWKCREKRKNWTEKDIARRREEIVRRIGIHTQNYGTLCRGVTPQAHNHRLPVTHGLYLFTPSAARVISCNSRFRWHALKPHF